MNLIDQLLGLALGAFYLFLQLVLQMLTFLTVLFQGMLSFLHVH